VHTDRLGSPDTVSSASGAVTARVRYGTWGRARLAGKTAPAGLPGFAGGIPILGTGYIQFGARLYDTNIGAFISADPLTDPGDTATGPNGYAYAGNNPVSVVDPSGYDSSVYLPPPGGISIDPGYTPALQDSFDVTPITSDPIATNLADTPASFDNSTTANPSADPATAGLVPDYVDYAVQPWSYQEYSGPTSDYPTPAGSLDYYSAENLKPESAAGEQPYVIGMALGSSGGMCFFVCVNYDINVWYAINSEAQSRIGISLGGTFFGASGSGAKDSTFEVGLGMQYLPDIKAALPGIYFQNFAGQASWEDINGWSRVFAGQVGPVSLGYTTNGQSSLYSAGFSTSPGLGFSSYNSHTSSISWVFPTFIPKY
jgi:RHS repeat-associated protein